MNKAILSKNKISYRLIGFTVTAFFTFFVSFLNVYAKDVTNNFCTVTLAAPFYYLDHNTSFLKSSFVYHIPTKVIGLSPKKSTIERECLSYSGSVNKRRVAALPEIDIQGNSISIASGDITPSLIDNTDFGSITLSIPFTQTFTIKNTGGSNLLLSGVPKVVITGSTEFSVVTLPSSPVASAGFTTFSIKFTPTSIGLKVATLSIENNDTSGSKNPYTFTIQGIGDIFFDSDGDGVYDNKDADDDNDGIKDVIEESNCNNSNGHKVNYKFLNETFGTGARTTINTTYNATTTYCYQDATTATVCEGSSNSTNLNDGKYTVGASAQIASWAANYWYKGTDHTGDVNGRMALFNASNTAGVFYTASIAGALPNLPISYSFWVLNLDRTDASGIATRKRPNIKVEFKDLNGNTLATILTGDIAPCSVAGNLASDWHQFTANLNIPTSTFKVIFTNNNTGGAGNDLAIDDILITQPLCDFDGDGIPDVYDLDSDNDGIPDVVEAGLGNLSNGKGKIDMTQQWTDVDGNGMHDLIESNIPLNTDGDSQPNYIDLDSDNDSVFDVDESGAGNSNAVVGYQNGDGDINGDGVGDGPESELFRYKDSDGDGNTELYGDGILDIYDKGNGATFALKYGNSGQGVANANPATTYLKDTDNDGIPDYLDLTSNGSTFDIANNKILYPAKILDANNDGKLDSNTDIDYDGIPDIFDTNTTQFGSPRDINTKLYLNFDGRNDYAEGKQLLSSLAKSSMMGWIKLNSPYSNNGIIMGQDNFNISVDASKKLTLTGAGQTITFATALDMARWYHVAGAYDGSATPKLRLYLNGTEVATTTSGTSSLASSTAKFTIAKSATASNNYFNGFIDEARVFNAALSQTQIQKMMCQEIDANGALIRGNVIPKDIELSTWASLIAYYRMDTYKNDVIDDYTISGIDDSDTNTNFTRIYNIKNINLQSAPMPYLTKTDNVTIDVSVNDLTNFIKGTDVYTAAGSILRVQNTNLTSALDMTNVGLLVNTSKILSTSNNTKIENSWYLKLDGTIDLQGKSQLLQTTESDLESTTTGYIERDQQGQANIYNYNYWSSPVSTISNASNNNGYTVAGVMKDGFNSTPREITWLATYDGIPASSSNPVSLARYWLNKFESANDAYANWIRISEGDALRAGQGYTLKGGGGAPETKFTFVGKPNNGKITNTVGSGQLLLIGNPYPSAIDAYKFLDDNLSTVERSTIDGTLYFWQHALENNTHILANYLGSYGVLNRSGGIAAVAPTEIAGAGTAAKIPNQYIPVGQGFFVYGTAAGGLVEFNNSQRAFVKENETTSNALFKTIAQTKKTTNETETTVNNNKKIRLGYNTNNNYHRQVLLAFMNEKATSGMDIGYDGEILDDFPNDMYLLNGEIQLVIEGEGFFDVNNNYPIGVKADSKGKVSFTIDALENFDANQQVYIFDKLDNSYHLINTEKYELEIPEGTFSDRFELRFHNQTGTTLGNEDFILTNNIKVIVNQNVIVKSEKEPLKSIIVYDLLGRKIDSYKKVSALQLTLDHLNKTHSGLILKITLENDEVISKKIIY